MNKVLALLVSIAVGVGSGAAAQESTVYPVCIYVSAKPVVFALPGAHTKGCLADVACALSATDVIRTSTLCLASANGECPLATDCFKSKEPELSPPSNANTLTVFEPHRGFGVLTSGRRSPTTFKPPAHTGPEK